MASEALNTEIIPEIKGLRRLGEPAEDADRIEIGPQAPYFAPITRLNMLTQVRKNIGEEDLDELTEALIVKPSSDDRPTIKLLQPITVGLFDKKKVKPYLNRLNEVWGSNHSIRDLVPVTDDDEYFLVVIAGHRRTLAVQLAAEETGVDKEKIDLEFHLQYGKDLTFRNAIQTQYRENFHKKPDTWEDAQAINSILEEGIKSGDYKTFVDCARDLGVNKERVSRAFRFQTLPESAKESVKDNILQFGRAIALSDLFSVLAYDRSHENMTDADKANIVEKINQNRLYLNDVITHVPTDEVASLEASFAHHVAKVSSLQSVPAVRSYITELIESIMTDSQLELVQVTQKEMNLEEQRKQRTSDRKIATDGLKAIVGMLGSEEVRLKSGLPPALANSKRARQLLSSFHAGLEKINHHELPDEDIVEVGNELIEVIEATGQDDQMDGFTQRTLEA